MITLREFLEQVEDKDETLIRVSYRTEQGKQWAGAFASAFLLNDIEKILDRKVRRVERVSRVMTDYDFYIDLEGIK